MDYDQYYGNAGALPSHLTTLPISVTARPERRYLLSGLPNTIHMLFEIQAVTMDLGEVPRVPIDLVIVLDRSGSMEGEKMQFAKEAIISVIEGLTGEDRLHFVVYDDKVDIIFEDGNLSEKPMLIEKVAEITAKGGTNLSGGLYKGFQILRKNNSQKKGIQRIFLFSDGKANYGITAPAGILKIVESFVDSFVTVSTFGLGEDFDEDTMRRIAEHGRGDYYFLETPTEIVPCVQRAFESLVGLVGINGNFKVYGSEGGRVIEVYGPENPGNGYIFGDLNSTGVRNIVVAMEVTPEEWASTFKALSSLLAEDDKNQFLVMSIPPTPILITNPRGVVHHQ